ncbi:hypothetical protein NC99_40980 [Sunxiuqinia dokdonensis]|uniref:Uncharacterized protein n=1 Tax=Sunxiuqinia dokdonensis TaxID=1409788 RepID=A0A0L8V3M5_9BACT|nr:hypothetical protein NC99_40980 [Sunxiuqinia dokdonensis]
MGVSEFRKSWNDDLILIFNLPTPVSRTYGLRLNSNRKICNKF